MLRPGPNYQKDAWVVGLQRHGFTIEKQHPRHPEPGDLCLLWNRTRGLDCIARMYEAAGATVLIAENGYLSPNGAKMYALAKRHHNGKGEWYVGDEPRHTFQLNDWRSAGDHIVLLPQRGIGIPGIAMPHQWVRQVMERLRKVTDRPIRVRPHPGMAKSDPWPDLQGAHCAVTWGSGAGIKAIAHGIPVFHELNGWIGSGAAVFGTCKIEDCFTGDRGPMFHRLSWAQWSLEEVRTGKAFEHLI